MSSQLLVTKLYIPRSQPNLVLRPRLLERLEAGAIGPATVVCTPTGYGKTTLVSEWVHQGQRPATWLSLDGGDNDTSRFWSYFIAALQTLGAGTGESALALLQSTQPPSHEAILTTLINEITSFSEDFALVLDDYHVINVQTIHSAISFLIEHLPPHMHLVIISRLDPPLPRARSPSEKHGWRVFGGMMGPFLSKTYLPYEPDQQLLLPAALQEWLPDDHLASDVVDPCRRSPLATAGTAWRAAIHG